MLLRTPYTYRIQRFQTVATTHDNQLVVDDGHAKLQPPAGHVLQHRPSVQPRTIALDADGALVRVQSADGQQLAHRRFARPRSLVTHLRSAFGQQVPFEGLHHQLLAADRVALRFDVVGNELEITNRQAFD